MRFKISLKGKILIITIETVSVSLGFKINQVMI